MTAFHPTALARTEPSAPLRHLADHAPEVIRGAVLDFGSGRGVDAEAVGAEPFDPWHPDAAIRRLPAGQFDLVLLIYVLNVLRRGERRRAVLAAKGKVRRGGYLLVAVRPEAEIARSTAGWTPSGDGYQATGREQRFQRGYTTESLLREIDRWTPGTWSYSPMPALAGSVTVLLRRDR